MIRVTVASNNPVKINAAKNSFTRMFPEEEIDVVGVSAPSGVPDQPIGNEETLKGAQNRVENVSKLSPDSDYWVGIEGGIDRSENEMCAFAWIVIKSKEGKTGKGKTGIFYLPNKVAELVNQGKELGDAIDAVFDQKNSKHSEGAVGILTGGLIPRTAYYEPAVIFALIPFKNKSIY